MDFSGFFFAPGIFWVMSEDKGFLWGLEFCLHSIITKNDKIRKVGNKTG